MRKSLVYILFLAWFSIITFSQAQVQTLGGCGPSFSTFIPGDLPTYGAVANQWWGTTFNDSPAPFNVMKSGVWCGTRLQNNAAPNKQQEITCSSAYNIPTIAYGHWVDNTCGTGYNIAATPQVSNTFSVTDSGGLQIPYNLCENVSSTVTGAFFAEQDLGGGAIFAFRLLAYPQALTITGLFLAGGRTVSGVPYMRCSTYEYFVQDATTIIYNAYDTGTNMFTFNIASYPGFTVLSWLDDLNLGFFRNTTHVISGTINRTAFTIYDAMAFPAGSCTPAAYSQMNTLTGYLYTVCFQNFNSGPSSLKSAIFQVNLVNFKFIRSKTTGFQWNYRNVFIGINHQLMSVMSNASAPSTVSPATPLLYCIADPYNPVLATQPTIIPGIAFNRIAAAN